MGQFSQQLHLSSLSLSGQGSSNCRERAKQGESWRLCTSCKKVLSLSSANLTLSGINFSRIPNKMYFAWKSIYDFDFLPPSEGLWIVGWRWHPWWGWHPSLTDAAPQLVLRVGVITNIVIITINGEMSVMIKVGMCQCQNPTIHYKLQRQQLALVTCSARPQC